MPFTTVSLAAYHRRPNRPPATDSLSNRLVFAKQTFRAAHRQRESASVGLKTRLGVRFPSTVPFERLPFELRAFIQGQWGPPNSEELATGKGFLIQSARVCEANISSRTSPTRVSERWTQNPVRGSIPFDRAIHDRAAVEPFIRTISLHRAPSRSAREINLLRLAVSPNEAY
jgi:hypothetical protein